MRTIKFIAYIILVLLPVFMLCACADDPPSNYASRGHTATIAAASPYYRAVRAPAPNGNNYSSGQTAPYQYGYGYSQSDVRTDYPAHPQATRTSNNDDWSGLYKIAPYIIPLVLPELEIPELLGLGEVVEGEAAVGETTAAEEAAAAEDAAAAKRAADSDAFQWRQWQMERKQRAAEEAASNARWINN